MNIPELVVELCALAVSVLVILLAVGQRFDDFRVVLERRLTRLETKVDGLTGRDQRSVTGAGPVRRDTPPGDNGF